MTKTDVLSGNLLVQASCKDNTTLKQTRQDVRWGQALGQIHGSHTMSLCLGTGGELPETKLSDSSLNLIRDLGVLSEAAGDVRSDLKKSGVQGVNELGRRGSEVGGLVVLVVLHNGKPVGDRGVVRSGGSLAVLGGLDGAGGGHDDAETGRAADGLLGGCHDGIEVPLVEGNLLRTDGANSVDDHEGLGADAAHQLRYALDVGQDTG